MYPSEINVVLNALPYYMYCFNFLNITIFHWIDSSVISEVSLELSTLLGTSKSKRRDNV